MSIGSKRVLLVYVSSKLVRETTRKGPCRWGKEGGGYEVEGSCLQQGRQILAL